MIKIFQYSGKFLDNSVFQGKCKLLKNPECTKYIRYSDISGQLCFSGRAQVAQKS